MHRYPLQVVVSESAELASVYNQDFDSACLLSECLTASAVGNLIDKGANLESLIFLDKIDKYLIDNVISKQQARGEVLPEIKIFQVKSKSSRRARDLVPDIHKFISPNRYYAGICGGNG